MYARRRRPRRATVDAPRGAQVWTAATSHQAYLAYEACLRVCLSAQLAAAPPAWARAFLGDGSCAPLQRAFCLQSNLLQVRPPPLRRLAPRPHGAECRAAPLYGNS